MFRIKKNDMVKVLAGKDKGKTGKVINVMPSVNRAVVQGVNFVKKHARKRKQDEQGGIVQKESPLHISNLALVCKACNRVTKVAADILDDGSRVRVCKKCREVF